MIMPTRDKEKQDPKLKEKHKERRIKKDMLNKIKNNEWVIAVRDYKNSA